MKKVVVLSDTHGLLRPQVLECLEGADLMVHAGDINTQAIVDQLASYGPLQVVRGNNDKDWAQQIPLSCRFTVEDVSFFMVHNKRDVPRDLAPVDVIVYGHSHKYAREEKDGVLWLNPGSCGPSMRPSCAVVELSGGEFTCRIEYFHDWSEDYDTSN